MSLSNSCASWHLGRQITPHAGIDSFVHLLRSYPEPLTATTLFPRLLELPAYCSTILATYSAAWLSGIGDLLKISQSF